MKRTLRKTLFAILGALGFGALVFGGLIGFLLLRSRPTPEPRIPTFPTHRTALLVVDRLIVVGLDAAYCVDSTVRGALNRGFQVTLCPQGLGTRSGECLESLGEAWRKVGAILEAKPEL